MARARDEKRRNNRANFALFHPNGEPVGAYVITYADGCSESFREDGSLYRCVIGGPNHTPGEHEPWMRAPARDVDPYAYDYDEEFA